jgi:hypothetical protein
MATIISNTCAALLWVLPAVLLAVRFFWPKRMPWWLMVALAMVFSSLLVTAIQKLTFQVDEESFAACLANPPPSPDPAVDPCPMRIVDYYFMPWYARWMSGLLGLALLLPIYGILHVARMRRRAVAA